MQSKGLIKWVAILLCLACIYELSFTWVTKSVEKDAVEYAESFVANDPACKIECDSVNALKAKDSLSKEELAYVNEVEMNHRTLLNKKEKFYLDSLVKDTVKVYNLGLVEFSYMECKEKELNLGLDLKGGMNVMLEIQVQDVVKALAGEESESDSLFMQALAIADEKMNKGESDYIKNLQEAYNQVSNGKPLANIFISQDRQDIQSGMSDDEVAEVLKNETDAAISASFNVISNRIDRFGVVQPNIQRIPNTNRILVELPGVKDPERVRKLLQGSASLEFWTTHSDKNGEKLSAVLRDLRKADELILSRVKAEADVKAVQTEVEKAVAEADKAVAEADKVVAEATSGLTAEVAAADKKAEGEADAAVANEATPAYNSLLSLLDTSVAHGAVVGAAVESDIETIDKYLAETRECFSNDVRFVWGIKGDKNAKGKYLLYAIEDINGKAPLDGSAIADARDVVRDGSAEVSMAMNSKGISEWAKLTGDNVGACIAIVLDGRVYSAPVVNGKIEGGNSSITGDFSIQEATDLANVLKSGKVPAPARIIQDTVVGPSLGQESIDAGLLSFVLAFILVLLYMVLFYKTAGLLSDVALIANIFLLIGCVVSFGSVLTLPGIAGIVLTMGMAVDANVIIYERIKEELRGGKGIHAAIKDGFSNAYSAIIDGNLTTIITGVVLFFFGNGPVKGFATTLVIGILTSMFTAIFITRLLIDKWVEKRGKISFSFKWSENLLSNFSWDFIGKRFWAYGISGVVILAGVISLAVQRLNFGTEFTGGRTYEISFDHAVSTDAVREALDNTFAEAGADAANSSIEVKQYGEEGHMRIVTQYKYDDTSEATAHEVDSLLHKALNPLYETSLTFEEFSSTQDNPNGIISSEKIGPAIAKDTTEGAVLSVLFALVAIGIYIVIRFRKWQWAAGATIALIHDAFMIIAMFSLFYSVMPFSLEVNQAFIAAILTIIGYSINDTVVIFDRIREHTALYPKRDLKSILNGALSSTMMRTLNTSGTTLITLLAIFILGGESIRGFVFALIIGIVVGTYSSVFIASPLAYDMQKKNAKKE
ncbi:MAG: protein translocase subunit SecDF [Alistipes sp.]|nr:protein translocase subunit SecDF [Alistipes sp.]